jgi:hypothetical protein
MYSVIRQQREIRGEKEVSRVRPPEALNAREGA